MKYFPLLFAMTLVIPSYCVAYIDKAVPYFPVEALNFPPDSYAGWAHVFMTLVFFAVFHLEAKIPLRFILLFTCQDPVISVIITYMLRRPRKLKTTLLTKLIFAPIGPIFFVVARKIDISSAYVFKCLRISAAFNWMFAWILIIDFV